MLDARDGGDAPWHQPAFLLIQDTPVSSLLESHTACDPNRGTPDSPLLLMNHWIDRFPPPLSENRTISDRAKLSAPSLRHPADVRLTETAPPVRM